MANRYDDSYDSSSMSTRSGRNARLYKEVYGKYGDSDNLPIEDNTNEIDMESLKELVLNSNRKKSVREYSNLDILEDKPRKIDDERIYDINEMLEKAKYENNKLKEPVSYTSNIDKKILSTLENNDFSIDSVKKDTDLYEKRLQSNNVEDELSLTRELKFKKLAKDNENVNRIENEDANRNDNVISTSELSLDMFSDLKPTSNTIVTKPIENTSEFLLPPVNTASFIKPLPNTDSVTSDDFLSSDTRDIDVIKDAPKSNVDKDFFTSSYEFSKKDFMVDDDDEFTDSEKSSGLIKIFLLFLFIAVLVGVIVYFVLNYGIGV